MLPIRTKSPACLKRGAPALETARPEAFPRFGRLGDMGLSPESEPQKRTTREAKSLRFEEPHATTLWPFNLTPSRSLSSFPPRYILLHLLIPALFNWNGGHSLFFGVCTTCDISRFSQNFTNFRQPITIDTTHTLTYSYLCPPSAITLCLAPLERTAIAKFQESMH